ncbi:DUF262 domain-containing protein [Parasphingorhabdus sp.]|uniref:DUF262 domain-containing protein n=1 Tax=Parasphingorhabdus sp. TaxID=2709688 RepID=UPI0035944CD4
MSSIEVKAITIAELLSNLHSGEWLTPEFQRDFVWSNAQIIGLINSIIDSKPIGMATIWQQEDKSELPLEHISINDWDNNLGKSGPRYFGNKEDRPGRYYAILDGKQRSTSIAMAFGGLRAQSGGYRNSGSYFLNVDYDDMQDRVQYLSKKEIAKLSLDSLPSYVQHALFPLELESFEKLSQYFFKLAGAIENAANYPGEALPPESVIAKRQEVLQAAHDGISKSKLAVYIVPKKETLGDICDIFEVLNTTGTKVSTVDLIHASIYAETAEELNPVLLREEIDYLSELDGLQGWSTSTRRPEFIAQNVAGIQIALSKKHSPRAVNGRAEQKISSIKSSDLLAISSASWKDFFAEKNFVAQCFLDFQIAVAGGRFSLADCPYPGIFNVYIALRWYLKFDSDESTNWTKGHLDRLFRAFFWRNTFSKRYDQGFLTRVSSDITSFKAFLQTTSANPNDQKWSADAEKFLRDLPQMGSKVAIDEAIEEAIKDGNVRGALQSGGVLLLHTRADKDLVEPSQDISHITSSHDLHHILPRAWCHDNVTAVNKAYLRTSKDHENWVDSPANLIPMASKSNKKWNTMAPQTAFETLDLQSAEHLKILGQYFVDNECVNLLQRGPDQVGAFLERRALLLIDEINRLMRV